MARRAVDVETFLAAPQHIGGKRKWQAIAGTVRRLHAGEEVNVLHERPASEGAGNVGLVAVDRAGDQRPALARVFEEIVAAQRLHPGLIVHVLPAAGNHKHKSYRNDQQPTTNDRSVRRPQL